MVSSNQTTGILVAIGIIVTAIVVGLIFYNITPQPQPQPQPEPKPVPEIECGQGTHLENGTCVADPVPVPICNQGELLNTTTQLCERIPTPTPTPTPVPSNESKKVIVVGDVADTSSGNKVYNAIKAQNADYVFVLGDLGYGKVSWFKSTYGSSDKTYCIIGNHEAANEDGSSSIEKEMLAFCGNSYWIKNGATLFVMLNTNDPKLGELADKTNKVFSNSTIMSGVNTVHIMSHKPCAVPPNSHHGVEVKSLCDSLKIPNLTVFYDQAHNHVYSESADKKYKQIGTGGKSHYSCGTSTAFPYCNDSDFGYLVYTIKPDGTTTSQFLDYNGVVKK
jgi:hypothetical protein